MTYRASCRSFLRFHEASILLRERTHTVIYPGIKDSQRRHDQGGLSTMDKDGKRDASDRNRWLCRDVLESSGDCRRLFRTLGGRRLRTQQIDGWLLLERYFVRGLHCRCVQFVLGPACGAYIWAAACLNIRRSINR
ncbi:uncharacterized protein K489DRAFT_75777 [Dissoconium aciculare CBS 342.82]|uniref:Uncharacterized protein n=1 Tax=Dissoconium aciculare CBS 342.82 TaxID=1314786 RepID=A0A6J3LX00_9PEZI|nr:uncharacterized protein K489DRAFT_75777 [Dissoconium aciculare CBS 342.82]KAF1819162.1 hypothetical protein K489DRAFT_75777 [Dissoconium aciculare CBS 342.82]